MFALKNCKTESLKQHGEQIVRCLTATLCARIVHHQLLCMSSVVVWSF